MFVMDIMGVDVEEGKCMWWMPWRLQAMKDVVACDKLRGVASRQ